MKTWQAALGTLALAAWLMPAATFANAGGTGTRTATRAGTATKTPIPTKTATKTRGPTKTATKTRAPSTTATPAATATHTAAATETATLDPPATETATLDPPDTETPTPDPPATDTPTVDPPDETVTATPTASVPSATATASAPPATPPDTPSVTPTATPICATTPRSDCRNPAVPGRWVVLLRNVADRKDHLVWKWRGVSSGLDEFADPLTTTDYSFCLYAGTAAAPVLAARAPAGSTCGNRPCWVKRGERRYKYVDHDRTPDGLTRMVLRANPSRTRANLVVVGRGINLEVPPLPLELPVRGQVVKSDGPECWEAHYSAPALKNSQRQFRDKND